VLLLVLLVLQVLLGMLLILRPGVLGASSLVHS
jgi:hypothetical protein